MATQLQIRRGTASQIAAFTGAEGEVVVNTTNDSIVVSDGSTAGGFEMARADLNNVSDTSLNAALTGNTVSALTVTSLTSSGINVTGTVTADGLTSSGNIFLDGSGNPSVINKTSGAGNNPIYRLQADTNYWDLQGTFSNTNDELFFIYNGSTKMAITNAGNVGIGVTPDGALSLESPSYTAGGIANGIRFQNGNNTADAIIQSYYSGTSSSALLHGVNSYLSTGAAFTAIDTNKPSSYFLQNTNGSFDFGSAQTGNPSSKVTIDTSGRVGIGMTPPSDRNLAVYDSTNSIISLHNSTTGTAASDGFQLQLVSDDAYLVNYEAGGMVAFYTAPSGGSTTQRMLIDSAGSVGLGCTPDAWSGYSVLQIGTSGALSANEDVTFLSANAYSSASGWKYVTTDEASLYQQTSGLHIWYGAASGSADAAVSWAESMRIDSGNLLVGTTTTFTTGDDNTGAGSVFIARNGNPPLSLKRAGSNGTIASFIRGGVSSPVGSISITASATAYNTSSDYRLKESIVDAPSASDDIDAIQVRSFDWKADGSHQKYGMVAQELQSVAPEAVSAPEDPEEMMGVDYSKLVPMLVKEIQSLRARVNALEAE